ncbi:MAG: hypothetical protein V1750_10255 [Acidobacteriota bacterium]
MSRRFVSLAFALTLATSAGARELTSAYVVTAAANKAGLAGTDWHTDLTLYNPHDAALPVVLQFLPSGRDNSGSVPTVTFEIAPWQTLNLWNVLGPNGFAARGRTGALLVYADDRKVACSGTSCDFVAFSRTYTLNPSGGKGEFGQDVPGFAADLGLDGSVIAYLPQISDDSEFRTNLGVASWTPAIVKVRVDLQNADGQVIDRRDHLVPPYGHVQWRLERGVTGGTAAVYILDGPANAIVYPYASVVNWVTGDGGNTEAHLSAVGLAAAAARVREWRRPPAAQAAPDFSLEALQHRSP